MGDAVSNVDSAIAIIGDLALNVAEAALIVEYPFLGLPVIKQIWEFFVKKLESRVIEELAKSANVIIIHISETENAKAARDAADALKKVQDAPIKDQASIDKATEDFKDAYSKLIRLRTTTPMP